MAHWDVLVIGGGAAGLSAAATAAGAGHSCVVIDRLGGGGELMNLGPLHDCPDLPPGAAGPDLAAGLLEAATAAGAELAIGEVTALSGGSPWTVATDEASHTARVVVLACGLAPGRLGIAGEEAFEGQGLSHCAACDGPLHRGQPVVVAGSDRWAVQEATDLTGIASRVTLVTQGGPVPSLRAAAAVAGRVVGLEGESGLEAVLVQPDGGGTQRLPARAIFVQSGRHPALGFAPGALALDGVERVKVDASLRCSMPMLFAAGDVRAGAPALVREAMADGKQAGLAAARALEGIATGPN
jgi:thioredoxin reductase (NADPH)